MAIRLLSLLFLLATATFGYSQATFRAQSLPAGEAPTGLTQQIQRFDLFDLSVDQLDRAVQADIQARSNSAVRLVIGAHDWTLQLYPVDLLGPDYYVTTGGGRIAGDPKQKAFQGYVNGNPEDKVRLTVDGDFIYGYVERGTATYYIEPLNYFEGGRALDGYVLYEAGAVLPTAGSCGVTETAKHRPQPATGGNRAAGVCYVLEMAIASDFLMFQKYGSVAGVENHNIAVLNTVQGNYDNEFPDEIFFLITTQFVATSAANDPFTTSTNVDNILDDFRQWAQGGGFGGASYDLGEMWSDRDFDGSTIGYASVGVVCSSFRYHILQDYTSNADGLRVLTSHEIGHNWSMTHDAQNSPFIMAPAANGSNDWSAQSVSQFSSHLADVINGPNCLSGCGPPATAFNAGITEICPGTTLQFNNTTAFSPTSFMWTFPGGIPGTSTEANPMVTYDTLGTYTVTLTASNSFGDVTETKVDYITVTASGAEILFESDFENGLNDWTLINPDNGTTWITATAPVGTAVNNQAAVIPYYNYSVTGQVDELVSAAVDLSDRTSATFSIEHAYARYNDDFRDSLIISVSNNNGATYTRLFADSEDGQGNFATRPDLVTSFTPEDETEWCTNTTYGPDCITLDLSDYLGFPQVRVKVGGVNGFGNNIWLDNALITASCLSSSVQAPTASAGSDVQSGCIPFDVQFNDLSANDPTSYAWSFPGGQPTTSTDPNPVVTYANAGEYDVTLIVGNGIGADTVYYSNFITADSLPLADFTFVQTGNTFDFTNTSLYGETFFWELGNGLVTTDEDASATYPGPGTYTVSLTVTNACGTATSTQQIVIPEVPSVAFTALPAGGCGSTAVVFLNQTGNGSTYEWTFPGGIPATSTAENPAVFYANPGSYTVTLTATNSSGSATRTEVDFIVIASTIAASFTVAPAGGTTYTFTNTSTDPASYLWDFGDGNTSTEQNPTHTYATSGSFMVTLTATNACGEDTATETVGMASPPQAAFSASTTVGCADLTVQYSSQSSSGAQTYAWSFAGGMPATSTEANPTVVYQTAGVYDVSLTVTNSVGSDVSTETNYIVVADVPNPSFTTQVNVQTVDFTHTGSGADSYAWDFGDGNSSTAQSPSHTYGADGTYTVTLTATNGCGDAVVTETVVILSPPAAAFSASTTVGCADLTVQFSSQNSTNAQTYAWTFAGGTPTTSTEPNPTVVYTGAGIFDVSLTVTNAAGSDQATQTDYIVVADVPTPSFTAQVSDQTVTFTPTGSGADSYAWDFGDGNTSTDQSPTHTYASDGSYTVTLTTTNGCGDASIDQTISVSSLPFAQFSAGTTSGCTPLIVQFTNQSSANSTDLAWSFPGGDPATSTDANPTVTYNSAGTFSVSLTATNAQGSDVQSIADYVVVGTTPTADFSTAQNGNTIDFTNLTTGADSFSWNFGDGSSSSLENPSNTYNADGTYTVVLSATNACGTVTSTQQITISSQPTAQFTTTQTSGCAPFTVTFSNQSSSNATDFAWTFPGGTPGTSTAADPTVTYNAAGTYDVTLTVTNAAGSDQQTQLALITVEAAPAPTFTAQTTGQMAQFNYTGTDADSYSWDFGDGNTATDASPGHTYAADGDYTVTLTATNACGSVDVSQTVTVATQPTAQFAADQTAGCTPFTVTFTNLSSDNSTGFSWSFPGGDPATSTAASPTVIYSTAGIYDVTLTALNGVGSDETTQTGLISVQSAPTPAFTAQVNDQTVAFAYTGTPATSYSWDFGDGNTATGTAPTHTYATDGDYTVVLTATNDCGDVDISQVVIVSSQPFAQFSADQQSGCAPFTVTFNNQSSGNSNGFAWSFPGGDPSSSTLENPTVTYDQPGNYDVELTASNAAGVNTATQAAFISVGAAPEADFTANPNGLTVSFTDASSGAGTYSWDFGDGNTSATPSPTHTYATDGVYTVILSVSNDCGTETSTQSVTVVSGPQAGFSADVTEACAGQVVNFLSEASDNTTSWFWTFDGGTPATSTDANPSVQYAAAGTYDVLLVVSNAAGTDQLSETAYIVIDDVPGADFTTTSVGNTYTFTNTSTNADTYQWDFGDGTTSTAISPSHTYVLDGAYTVTLTATNDCGTATATTTATVAMGAPIAAFSADQTTGCAPFVVQFENLSSDNADSFAWEFPGGSPATSNEPNPTVSYTTAGSYTVRLTVNNVNGSDQVEQTAFIEVLPEPAAAFTFSATGTTVSFTNGSTDADSFSWDFGDGSTSMEATPVVTYATPGTYTVVLTATNACGSATFSSQVTVTQGAQVPVPSFTADVREGCGPLTVQFSDASLNSPTNWSWAFEGGTPASSTEQNPIVVYDVAGEFDVQLQAGNVAGNNVLVSNDFISVGMVPDAEFTFAQAQYTFSFDAQSLGDSYAWDFGDGNTATGPSPVHTYATQGTFTVSFSVTNECGTDTKTQDIDVIVNSLEDYLAIRQFTINPNPNDGRFSVLIEGNPSSELIDVRLVDVLGRTLTTETHGFGSGRLSVTFDESLSAGVYLVHVRAGKRSAVRKVVVE